MTPGNVALAGWNVKSLPGRGFRNPAALTADLAAGKLYTSIMEEVKIRALSLTTITNSHNGLPSPLVREYCFLRRCHVALARLDLWRLFSTMTKISYAGYRFAPEIIQQAIWLYVRFTLSFRDVEDLLAERGIMVSYETVSALDEPFWAEDRG
jgi:hypothetical protein